MWRKRLVAILLCLFCMDSLAQSSEDMEKILNFTGYDSPEDLDEYEVDEETAIRDAHGFISELLRAGFITFSKEDQTW